MLRRWRGIGAAALFDVLDQGHEAVEAGGGDAVTAGDGSDGGHHRVHLGPAFANGEIAPDSSARLGGMAIEISELGDGGAGCVLGRAGREGGGVEAVEALWGHAFGPRDGHHLAPEGDQDGDAGRVLEAFGHRLVAESGRERRAP